MSAQKTLNRSPLCIAGWPVKFELSGGLPPSPIISNSHPPSQQCQLQRDNAQAGGRFNVSLKENQRIFFIQCLGQWVVVVVVVVVIAAIYNC